MKERLLEHEITTLPIANLRGRQILKEQKGEDRRRKDEDKMKTRWGSCSALSCSCDF